MADRALLAQCDALCGLLLEAAAVFKTPAGGAARVAKLKESCRRGRRLGSEVSGALADCGDFAARAAEETALFLVGPEAALLRSAEGLLEGARGLRQALSRGREADLVAAKARAREAAVLARRGRRRALERAELASELKLKAVYSGLLDAADALDRALDAAAADLFA